MCGKTKSSFTYIRLLTDVDLNQTRVTIAHDIRRSYLMASGCRRQANPIQCNARQCYPHSLHHRHMSRQHEQTPYLGGTDVLPQLSKLFCQLQLHCLEELGYSVSFPDNNLAPMACAIPVAVCHGQRFILHYLSASKQTRLLSSTVIDHAQTTMQHACLSARSSDGVQP